MKQGHVLQMIFPAQLKSDSNFIMLSSEHKMIDHCTILQKAQQLSWYVHTLVMIRDPLALNWITVLSIFDWICGQIFLSEMGCWYHCRLRLLKPGMNVFYLKG